MSFVRSNMAQFLSSENIEDLFDRFKITLILTYATASEGVVNIACLYAETVGSKELGFPKA